VCFYFLCDTIYPMKSFREPFIYVLLSASGIIFNLLISNTPFYNFQKVIDIPLALFAVLGFIFTVLLLRRNKNEPTQWLFFATASIFGAFLGYSGFGLSSGMVWLPILIGIFMIVVSQKNRKAFNETGLFLWKYGIPYGAILSFVISYAIRLDLFYWG